MYYSWKTVFFMFTLFQKIAAISSSTSSSASQKAALIFLHGLGDTPAGWSSLQFSLPQLQPRLSQLEFVFPPAPIIPISINGGATMPGWFDIYDWPLGVGVQDDKEGKLKAVEQVEAAVQKLEAKGIPRSRIVVGGFSQGGAIALLSAYYHGNRPPFGACVTLSGWLTLTQELNMKHATSTPVFWGHGKYDDKVLFEQQAHGVKILKEAGVKVQDREYPIGHESDPQELEDMAQFLVDCLFGNGEDGGGGGGSSSEL